MDDFYEFESVNVGCYPDHENQYSPLIFEQMRDGNVDFCVGEFRSDIYDYMERGAMTDEIFLKYMDLENLSNFVSRFCF